MSDVFYGAAVGAMKPADVTEDTSTTSAAVELRVTAGSSLIATLQALESIKNYLQTKEAPTVA